MIFTLAINRGNKFALDMRGSVFVGAHTRIEGNRKHQLIGRSRGFAKELALLVLSKGFTVRPLVINDDKVPRRT